MVGEVVVLVACIVAVRKGRLVAAFPAVVDKRGWQVVGKIEVVEGVEVVVIASGVVVVAMREEVVGVVVAVAVVSVVVKRTHSSCFVVPAMS